jgi:starvation-inducible outer membrane lipoprotein
VSDAVRNPVQQSAVLWFMICAASLGLSACVTAPPVAGNEIGGAVPLAGTTQEQASEMARAHCAKYARTARILATRPEAGGKVVFECV